MNAAAALAASPTRRVSWVPVRVHGFVIVRDEADIVSQGLDHLLTWCDVVYVLDNGSEDQTWAIVQERALREPARIRPIASIDMPFHIGARTVILDQVRGELETGDWISRLDIDEWYHEDPREFLRTRVAPHEHRVCIHHHNFVWTRSRAAYLASLADGGASLAQDIVSACDTYFTELPGIIEPRLFRFRRGMRWGLREPVPFASGPTARHRIPVRHYRWRSIPQARVRCALRAREASRSAHGRHWKVDDWQRFVWHDEDPRLRIWRPNATPPMVLVEPDYADHVGPLCARVVTQAAYALGLPQAWARVSGSKAHGARGGEVPRTMAPAVQAPAH